MTRNPCPLCGEGRDSPPLNLHHSQYEFCPNCSSLQRLAGISDEVQSKDFRSTYGSKEDIQKAARDRSRLWPEVLHLLPHPHEFEEKPRLLDVGCGYGDFLLSSRESGWEVLGIEINPTMRAICQERGVEVFSMPLCESTPPSEKFHSITYLNVLDSIADPVEELRLASQWLLPGGRVLIRVPNGALHGCLIKYMTKIPSISKQYHQLEATPLNAWLFHPNGIRSALKKAGFQNIRIYPSKTISGNAFTKGMGRIMEALGGLANPSTPLSTSILVQGELKKDDTR